MWITETRKIFGEINFLKWSLNFCTGRSIANYTPFLLNELLKMGKITQNVKFFSGETLVDMKSKD